MDQAVSRGMKLSASSDGDVVRQTEMTNHPSDQDSHQPGELSRSLGAALPGPTLHY